jgi:hypothetical protein
MEGWNTCPKLNTVKVVKNRESLRNCFSPKGLKEI